MDIGGLTVTISGLHWGDPGSFHGSGVYEFAFQIFYGF